MATFKAVVQRHQERRDGKFPVSIRITQNRKLSYIPTGLYVTKSQINKRSFEIKDQFVIERTNSTIREFEKKLLEIDTISLLNMSVSELKSYLLKSSNKIDFLDYCYKLIKDKPKTWCMLKSALRIIEDEMGYKTMYAMDFTANFIRDFKKRMDERDIKSQQKDGIIIRKGKMSVKTKENYLKAICAAFRRMREDYNTEFIQVIKHDPFVGFEPYKKEVTKKRAMSVETLRQFFATQTKTPRQQLTQDIMKISFCLCGINVADLFALTHDSYDEKNKRINYERQKTKDARYDRAFSSIKIEPEIESLLKKYIISGSGSTPLLKIGNYPTIDKLDRSLGGGCWEIAELIGLDYHISPYWFRHTWATIARNDCDISKDDIDLCLNHVGNNKMADVYIKPDWSRIDRANRKVLDYVFGKQKSSI